MKTQVIKESELNLQYILNRGIVTDLEYKTTVFEMGMEFLLELYHEDERWLREFSTDKRFWRWWRIEWDGWEKALIQWAAINKVEITRSLWLDEMRGLVHDGRTESGYNNYLKLCRNVRI